METVPQLGGRFDQYLLLEKLGEGGMGVVYLAEDTRLGRKVAIKFLPPDAVRDSVRRQRFEQEARAAAALSHPGIATVHELGEANGQAFIVFEYVPGSTLRHCVVSGGLQVPELLDIAADVAGALAAAHGSRVVHRDLKPENVVRTPARSCKILDFGLARLSALLPSDSATQNRLTVTGMVVGTVGYMSPEQLDGKEVDFRSDIFSFGVMIYELATGHHPFQEGSAASTIAGILTAEPVPLAQRNRSYPPELDRIVRKCLRKNPEDRYQSTNDLVVDLRNLKRESGETIPIASDLAEDDNNLFRGLQRLIPTPRRWWEVLTFFALIGQPPAIYVAWRIRQTSTEDWVSLVFLAYLANGIAHIILRIIVILTAAVVPRELPQRVGSFATALRLIYYSQGLLILLFAVALGFNTHSLATPFLIAVAILAFIWAGVYEPMVERLAFPTIAKAESAQERSQKRSFVWWWLHHLASMFATTPLVIWLSWSARTLIAADLRDPIFLFNALALGLHWSARFTLISQALGNPDNLPAQVQRMRSWIRRTGYPVVAGLLVSAFAVANADVALAGILAALAMGGIAHLLFLDPAVERAAFPVGKPS